MTLLEVFPPRIPVGEWVEVAMDWIKLNLRPLLDFFKTSGTAIYDAVESVLLAPPPLVMLAIFVFLAWLVRSWRLALGTLLSFLLIMSMGQWTGAMQTLALVVVATVTAIVIAVPLGIWAAKSKTASAILKPILDFLQTMPAMVYLIPAIMLFSLGAAPALFATLLFSVAPGVRLTELGIRGVDKETVEAGESFGATGWQILRGIQLPLAIPSIMAGINQVIMLAMSMAVIAGMVGADGLGKTVTHALSTLNTGKGAEAGLSIVFLAIFLDRITAALGNPKEYGSSLLSLFKKAKQKRLEAAEQQ